jgi:hypothetical protein
VRRSAVEQNIYHDHDLRHVLLKKGPKTCCIMLTKFIHFFFLFEIA